MKIAILFPGQGSQSVGMLSELYTNHEVVRDTFSEASEALKLDLWSLILNGPDEELNQTENTQPAMLASGVACWRLWQESGGANASLMAGHSLGEYTALVCAGVIDFADAVKLVAERGHLMQSAVADGSGAMAAILGLDDDTIRSVCADSAKGEVVQAVNFNSPGQVVIAGSTTAVDRAIDNAKAAGAKRAIKLPVSVPSHCDLMQPAAEKLDVYIQKIPFSASTTMVLHNVNAAICSDETEIKQALVSQLYQPVRWTDTIRSMVDQGVTHLVETGPGKVLTGLTKRIDKSVTALSVNDQASLDKALEQIRGDQ